ncbi:MAG TPA: hypothetical protein VF483_04600 [Gemmatimonadaceae bacterium]
MQRSYSVKTVALTVGADVKWLDNLLSHFSVVGVDRAGRGLERRISDTAITSVAICRMLSEELGIALGKAVSIANEIAAGRAANDSRFIAAPGLILHFSLDEIDRRVQARLADAVEAVAHVRRGRPPRRSHAD